MWDLLAESDRKGCGADQAPCGAAGNFGRLARCFLRHKLGRNDGKEHRREPLRIPVSDSAERHVRISGSGTVGQAY
jgi:hypothetical protein